MNEIDIFLWPYAFAVLKDAVSGRQSINHHEHEFKVSCYIFHENN